MLSISHCNGTNGKSDSLVRKRRWLVLMALAFILLTGCAEVPITGRSQLMILPEAQEIQMGMVAYQEVTKKYPVSTDPEINARVRDVGMRIARATGRNDYQWEFTVFDAPDTINAFALPGGKVGVFTGILRITENDVGLATVIAHEVAHAVARHGGERVSQGILLQMGQTALNAAVRNRDPGTLRIINAAFGLGVNVGVVLPFSREQESEADRLGLVYMAKAGYDPRGAVSFWRRMQQAEKGGRPPEFLSTHPAPETRIRDLQRWIPEALRYYTPTTR
ncbi:MAG: M48 family metallopeptidase [Deltaproteobacteria bacterium]|nr:M48 family metallopeptidase [Deltaproteobacteria bacterium]MBW2306703.1 M48 family metallopeptidase [Deltaproteobacteria bacterium]